MPAAAKNRMRLISEARMQPTVIVSSTMAEHTLCFKRIPLSCRM